jgi:hypothetical protein
MANSLPWTAPEGCVEHHRGLIERHVNLQPVIWRQEPAVGEVFSSRKEAEARLQVFALISGFDVVGRGGGNAKNPAIEIGAFITAIRLKTAVNWRIE